MYRKTFEFDAVIVNDSIICTYCAEEKGVDIDQSSPIFLDSEWDYYPSCEICGIVIGNINFLRTPVDDKDKPKLTIDYDSGTARLSAIDEYGNNFLSYERDSFAGEINFCELCGIIVKSGWINIDGSDIYCDDCIIEEN